MTSIWLLYGICALMLIIAIGAVLPTVFLSKSAGDGEALERQAAALAVKALQSEKKKLDADLEEGRITAAEYEPLLADLRRRVIEENQAAPDPSDPTGKYAQAKAGAPKKDISRAQLAAGIAALITAVSGASYAFLGTPEMLELVNAQKVMEGNASVESIEAYLKSAPKDGRAWVLFAHKKIEEGDFKSAARALRTAREVEPKVARDRDVMLEYGAAVLTAQETAWYADANRVVKEAYGFMAEDPRAERLALMAAVAAEDWKFAVQVVRTMLPKISPDTPDYMQARDTLNMLEQRAKMAAAIRNQSQNADEKPAAPDLMPAAKP